MQDFFTFNKRERKGVLVLVLLIVGLIAALNLMKYFLPENRIDFSGFKEEIARFEAAQDKLEKDYKKRYAGNYKNKYKKKKIIAALFSFNPNNLPAEKWKKLGLKDWQIKIIHNYEAKGGVFRKKDDLKKIYGISNKIYYRFEPYILLPEKRQDDSNDWKEDIYKSYEEGKKEYKAAELVIHLNTADTTELKKLKGIGSYFSKAIIKYRELLGGYNNVEQLKEIYHMYPEVVNSIAGHLVIDISKLKKINVNSATVKELKKHPYINWNVANLIVNYRGKHGQYQSLEDIMKTDLVDEKLYLKIAPYLEL